MSVSYCISTFPTLPKAVLQEAGRAGRDGEKPMPLSCMPKSGQNTLHKRVADTFSEKNISSMSTNICNITIKWPWATDSNVSVNFNLEEFCRKFKYFPVPVDSALENTDSSRLSGIYGRTGQCIRILFNPAGRTVQTTGNGTEAETLIQTILRSPTREYLPIMPISAKTPWLSAPD